MTDDYTAPSGGYWMPLLVFMFEKVALKMSFIVSFNVFGALISDLTCVWQKNTDLRLRDHFGIEPWKHLFHIQAGDPTWRTAEWPEKLLYNHHWNTRQRKREKNRRHTWEVGCFFFPLLYLHLSCEKNETYLQKNAQPKSASSAWWGEESYKQLCIKK